MTKKCGYIALIGAPNSGKSTLLNAALRKKISIVSNKPQTTRTRILGIVTNADVQMLFLDTPGLGKKAKSLAQSVWDACQDADTICYLIDLTRGWSKEDEECLKKISTAYTKKLFIIGTKADKLKKNELLDISAEFQQEINHLKLTHASFMTISAKKREDVEHFLSTISRGMPTSEWLYDSDSHTDCSQEFICAEFIREQLFRQLGEELPYQTGVVIEKLESKSEIVHIYATIILARESQKAIVIGRGGIRLKTIGQLSRESLEKYLGKKVFLKIFVKRGNV